MSKLKVYSLNGFRSGVRNPNGGHQTDEIVAARSMAEAARLFGTSLHHMRTYGHETGNDRQIEVAMSRPGVVFYVPSSQQWREGVEWTAVEPEG